MAGLYVAARKGVLNYQKLCVFESGPCLRCAHHIQLATPWKERGDYGDYWDENSDILWCSLILFGNTYSELQHQSLSANNSLLRIVIVHFTRIFYSAWISFVKCESFRFRESFKLTVRRIFHFQNRWIFHSAKNPSIPYNTANIIWTIFSSCTKSADVYKINSLVFLNSLTIQIGRVGSQRMDSLHIANEGPVRIQYKGLVLIYVFPEMKLSGLVNSKT
jgi:hypothetical protein